jgi:hypothetical protein
LLHCPLMISWIPSSTVSCYILSVVALPFNDFLNTIIYCFLFTATTTTQPHCNSLYMQYSAWMIFLPAVMMT